MHGILRQEGCPLRKTLINDQLKPSGKLTEVVLTDLKLDDLTPGKLYAIPFDDRKVDSHFIYNSSRELWTALNPSSIDLLEGLNTKEQSDFIQKRVNIYANLERMNETELGNFLYCRHPEYYVSGGGVSGPLFVVLSSGLCT